MAFTDTQLEQLKAHPGMQSPYHADEKLIKALLARLEAAEACIGKVGFHLKYTSELEAWRKSKGADRD